MDKECPFKDTDPKILAARKVAHNFMRKAMLHNPPIYDMESKPRNLQDTLAQELNLHDDGSDLQWLKPDPLAMAPVREYDPERERRETAEHEEEEKKDEIKRRFMMIYQAMAELADEKISTIDPDDFNGRLKPILATGPAFVTESMIGPIEKNELDARDNLKRIDEITRMTNRTLYPKLKDPNAVEFTDIDRSHTAKIIRYMHAQSKVMELAMNDFLSALNSVNAAIEGRNGHHY